MIRFYLIRAALALLPCSSVMAQLSRVEKQLEISHKRVALFEPASAMPGRRQVKLETGFNNGSITNAKALAELKGKQIESIELLYSLYAESPSYDQPGLNRHRLHSLASHITGILQQPFIAWQLTGQEAATREAASALFHGFVITYRLEPTEETMMDELRYIETALSKITTSSSSSVITPAAKDSSDWNFSRTIKVERQDTLLLKAIETAGMERTDTLYDTGLFGRRVFYLYTTDKRELPDLFGPPKGYLPYGRDTVVTQVLKRHINTWKDIAIVGDLTGSMSPYSTQLFTWYKINSTQFAVKRFVFFNDGNRKADAEKRIGETGGIYVSEGTSFDDMMNTARQTMKSGGGGDLPENNVEAILKAIEECSDCSQVVMIADNLASPRDMRQVYKIGKPVRVIVCGAQTGINTDYLDMARATKGSVHLMEEDLVSISEVQEGGSITIGSQTYTLKNGKFVAGVK